MAPRGAPRVSISACGSTSDTPMRHAASNCRANARPPVRYRTRRDQIGILSFRYGLGIRGGTRIGSEDVRSS